ncbi:hypothetical protein GCM10025768_27830 [Microbacterium pseudoresistens]|uniref:5-methylcytosine-specific restriction protein A n=1 Tax=Microbacterium pseudoresistens TaxID=640634 RepID=A0A7Y9JPI7_9MICO|nr:HNH endonuclease signature motif containing protein [Microbacterium pseudoresistens]NYD54684.1 5-methylcytosine-specific restriction protein A [Microbacterium pseudoresistens]
MNSLGDLDEALVAVHAVWEAAETARDVPRERLVAVNEALGSMRRRVDAVLADVAARIAVESRKELGPGGLAKQHGFRTPAMLIASATGASTGEANKFVAVGTATAPRMSLFGAQLPAKYPAVRDAVSSGGLSVPASSAIISLLDRMRLKTSAERIAEAEKVLAVQASGLMMDEVRKLLTRAEAWLDPDGVEPREERARENRSLQMFERDGMLHLTLQTDVASGAPVKAAIEGYVSAQFAARKNAAGVTDAEGAAEGDTRTVTQMRADALTLFAEHVLGCRNDTLPLAGATVIVRVNLEDLQNGTGTARIDGVTAPVSITTARRLAADGGVIPWVCGPGGDILDWGRRRRLFTPAQKLALTERDAGCAMCGLPPGMTQVHHIQWWERDTGPTDLGNGILLCMTCHHLIHDNGWDIRIDGTGVTAQVWFLPPTAADPERTPRPAVNRRLTPAA